VLTLGAVTDSDHWRAVVRRWQQLGPPLRPSSEDVQCYELLARSLAALSRPGKVLLLGVTPEVHAYAWPAGTRVLAVDHTQAMIDAIWPGPEADAVCHEWTALPARAEGSDLAICDGGVHLLPYPQGQRRLVEELARVLGERGACCFRLFVPPEQREAPEVVLSELLTGQIPNLNVLKLRLGMALQRSGEEGVAVHQVWQRLRDLARSWQELAERLGWPLEHLAAIDSYQGATNRYHFVTQEQVIDLFRSVAPEFRLTATVVPRYLLGERCPTVVFRR
jgi:SAM-dependent methyltransferase